MARDCSAIFSCSKLFQDGTNLPYAKCHFVQLQDLMLVSEEEESDSFSTENHSILTQLTAQEDFITSYIIT
jgi:hypothetical protein